MEDVIKPPEPSTPKGKPSGDVLTWSTPPPQDVTPSRKKEVKTSFRETPLATFQPEEYVPPQPAQSSEGETQKSEFTPQERNALIQALLGGSISGEKFKSTLRERVGIESSENLDHVRIPCTQPLLSFTNLLSRLSQNMKMGKQSNFWIL